MDRDASGRPGAFKVNGGLVVEWILACFPQEHFNTRHLPGISEPNVSILVVCSFVGWTGISVPSDDCVKNKMRSSDCMGVES